MKKEIRYFAVEFVGSGEYCSNSCPMLWGGKCTVSRVRGKDTKLTASLTTEGRIVERYRRPQDCPLKTAKELGFEELDI